MSFTYQQLADLVDGRLVLKTPEIAIESIADVITAKKNQLGYIANSKNIKFLENSKVGLVIVKEEWLNRCASNALVVKNPSLAFAKLTHIFKQKMSSKNEQHSSAVIDNSAIIDKSVKIAAFCVIGANVVIKKNCILQPHCIIEDNVIIDENCYFHPNVKVLIDVKIGKNCEMHSGCVIGSDGFANALDEQSKWHKIAQLGSVVIGDNVEIGANTTIDRGAINNTIIANGVRIDNLVHIAHNVNIGDDSAITACVAIAGSAKIGKRVLIGGNAAIADHINITDDVMITGLTAVDRDITEKGVYTGFMPYIKHKNWLKLSILWRTKVDKIVGFLRIHTKD
ncbi:UDP-3-O-[3-hydroxymyristoyl] glucosamine N-acyltransferase [hydrothermal vent metagenome]|uniref:UDP-3-O-[3-hydroxymyristoyl] glucosamine N-acyltransferase n=1 Tax=hydrothermal vent metagenome TaxID=652676 RepID=A0A1W1BFB2_9ZZZZ